MVRAVRYSTGRLLLSILVVYPDGRACEVMMSEPVYPDLLPETEAPSKQEPGTTGGIGVEAVLPRSV